MEVKPCCRCPRSSRGITAAFLYCEGYRETTSSMSFSLAALNLNGIDRLFSGVSRCCLAVRVEVQKEWRLRSAVQATYDIETVAAGRGSGGEGALLVGCWCAQHSSAGSEGPGRKFGCHCVVLGGASLTLRACRMSRMSLCQVDGSLLIGWKACMTRTIPSPNVKVLLSRYQFSAQNISAYWTMMHDMCTLISMYTEVRIVTVW